MPLHWTAIAVHCYLLLALAEAESETCSVQNASCGRALLQKQLTGSQAANCRPILIHFSECSDGEHWRALWNAWQKTCETSWTTLWIAAIAEAEAWGLKCPCWILFIIFISIYTSYLCAGGEFREWNAGPFPGPTAPGAQAASDGSEARADGACEEPQAEPFETLLAFCPVWRGSFPKSPI